MKNLILIMIAGGAGSGLRYASGVWLFGMLGGALPYGTFAVNILGALAMGYIVAVAQEAKWLTQEMSLLLTTGFLGGLTTFSSLALQGQQMFERREFWVLVWYLGGTVMFGIGAVWLGMKLGRY